MSQNTDGGQEADSWPPPPVSQDRPRPAPAETTSRWGGVAALAGSAFGAVCIAIGSSGPSTGGLSGEACGRAFEANEDLMFWTPAGFLLLFWGLLAGLYHRRTWLGKAAMAVALGVGLWSFLG